MTIEQAKEILEKWKCRGSDGLTDERLGYIEGWYNKKDDVAFEMAIKSLEAWDKAKKEMLSQSIIKTHTESYESGFSDGLERAFDIIQDIIEQYLEGE